MKWMTSRAFALLATVALSASAASAATLEEVQKSLVEAHAKLKSFTARFESKQDMAMENMTIKGEYQGTQEFMRKGDKALVRSEMKGKSVQTLGMDMDGDGKVAEDEVHKQEMDSNNLMVCDGDWVYTVTDQMGQKSCYKSKANEASTGDIKAMFESWKDQNPTVLPDEKVDGQDCWVIETQNSPTPMPGPQKARYFLRKDCGIVVRSLMLDDKGKVVAENVTKDIKLNPDINPDRFVFKAPEGVEIQEMPSMP